MARFILIILTLSFSLKAEQLVLKDNKFELFKPIKLSDLIENNNKDINLAQTIELPSMNRWYQLQELKEIINAQIDSNGFDLVGKKSIKIKLCFEFKPIEINNLINLELKRLENSTTQLISFNILNTQISCMSDEVNRIRVVSKRLKQRLQFVLTLKNGNEITNWLSVNYLAKQPVAIQKIAKGRVITKEMFDWEWRKENSSLSSEINQDVRYQAKQSLIVGDVFSFQNVKKLKAVEVGDEVTLYKRSDSILIEAKAIALTSADLGGKVKVKVNGAENSVNVEVIGVGKVKI